MDVNLNFTSKPCILLVEDAPIVQKVHKYYLEQMNCHVDIASDGKTALSLLEKRYHLILMDINLPNSNGIELTAEIRRQEKNRQQAHIPIIALTTHPPHEIQEQCNAAGINAITTKPITYESFRKVVRAWLPSIHPADTPEEINTV